VSGSSRITGTGIVVRLPWLRPVAQAVMDAVVDHAVVPPARRRGSPRPAGADQAPVTVLWALGRSTAQVLDALHRLADVPTRWVLVVDGPRLAQVRGTGWPAEMVLDAQEWHRRHPDRPWSAHVAVRRAQLDRDHRPVLVVAVPDPDEAVLDPADVTAALAAATAARPRPAAWRRALAAVERRIDAPSAREVPR
jgi:hypothetical protein